MTNSNSTYTYIQFAFLYGTRTYKVQERTEKPRNIPANAQRFRHFELEGDMPAHMANELPVEDTINPSEWQDIVREEATVVRP